MITTTIIVSRSQEPETIHMKMKFKILVLMTALATFQHFGGRGYPYRDVDPSAYCIRYPQCQMPKTSR
jgi:hypothetical protein